jgi:DNA-binding MarR family transcriptional regulator
MRQVQPALGPIEVSEMTQNAAAHADQKPQPPGGNAWNRLAAVLTHVRKRYPNMTVGTLACLVEIARNHRSNHEARRTLTEIADALDVSYPTFTRQTDHLGEGSGGRKGLGLIAKTLYPHTAKSKSIELTQEGMHLLLEIDGMLTAVD